MKYCVAISEEIHQLLISHLIRDDGQEDLCFAFYSTSTGKTRITGVINTIMLPNEGDRNVHGNVSFNSQYFDRVTQFALKKQLGICFIHSHPGPGWQGMSFDDIKAEEMLAPRVKAITKIPLIGLTIGNDETWSARFWIKIKPKIYSKYWCESVRVVGQRLSISYNEKLLPSPAKSKEFQRTISSWGAAMQADITRLKVGIVGLGSVGSLVATALYRTGVKNVKFIDFDIVKEKNLDRMDVPRSDIGQFKASAVKKRLLLNELHSVIIEDIPYSIIEKEGLEKALDCDVIFCGVDRPWPRFVLDSFSKANYIPVIDGGIDANPKSNSSNLDQARWKSHTVGPGRVCMNCLNQYQPEDVALEQSGLLEDQHYIKSLPRSHFINRGENVYIFSQSLASQLMCQFLSLILQPRGIPYGPKEFDFNTGNIDSDYEFLCSGDCSIDAKKGKGDQINKTLISKHKAAEDIRKQANNLTAIDSWTKILNWFHRFSKIWRKI
ncbi:MAG: ThiF family adenylyltransferase [Cytophagales bacterium]